MLCSVRAWMMLYSQFSCVLQHRKVNQISLKPLDVSTEAVKTLSTDCQSIQMQESRAGAPTVIPQPDCPRCSLRKSVGGSMWATKKQNKTKPQCIEETSRCSLCMSRTAQRRPSSFCSHKVCLHVTFPRSIFNLAWVVQRRKKNKPLWSIMIDTKDRMTKHPPTESTDWFFLHWMVNDHQQKDQTLSDRQLTAAGL